MRNFGMIAAATILAMSQTSFADIKSVTAGEKRVDDAVDMASSIFAVKDAKLGKLSLRLVEMDSGLNGDVTETAILLIGQGGVGGNAGYDAAFILSPGDEIVSATNLRVVNSKIEVTFHDLEGKTKTKLFKYDAATKSLVDAKK